MVAQTYISRIQKYEDHKFETNLEHKGGFCLKK